MIIYLANVLILLVSLVSLTANASSYNGESNLDISVIMADEITVTIDNNGIIEFIDLEENDVIDTSTNYNIVSDASRSFNCYISYDGTNYNIGESISAPLVDSSNNNSGIDFSLTFLSCQAGSNSMSVTGNISLALNNNTTYHINTQFISVGYVPTTITTYT
ncbi:MAG: hypothetical protein HOM96_00995 [Rickettsiales bacterium]|jgi:hypothetical protein|nr:hypothetical protein [Rickettsiales bacterium]